MGLPIAMRRKAEQAMTLGLHKASGLPTTTIAELHTVRIKR